MFMCLFQICNHPRPQWHRTQRRASWPMCGMIPSYQQLLSPLCDVLRRLKTASSVFGAGDCTPRDRDGDTWHRSIPRMRVRFHTCLRRTRTKAMRINFLRDVTPCRRAFSDVWTKRGTSALKGGASIPLEASILEDEGTKFLRNAGKHSDMASQPARHKSPTHKDPSYYSCCQSPKLLWQYAFHRDGDQEVARLLEHDTVRFGGVPTLQRVLLLHEGSSRHRRSSPYDWAFQKASHTCQFARSFCVYCAKVRADIILKRILNRLGQHRLKFSGAG